MSEEFILSYIPIRLKQLGYTNYHIRYRDLTIRNFETKIINAYADLYFIIGAPVRLIIESDYGIYDSTGTYLAENEHQHKGEISIYNPDSENKRIQLIQVIIVS